MMMLLIPRAIITLIFLAAYFILSIIIVVAYLTLFERKVLAAMQKRQGPCIVGFWGILQPISDALKLIMKELVSPQQSNMFLFFLGPFLMLVLSISGWFIIPFNEHSVIANLNIGILYIFMVSSLNVLNIIMAGWASNSRYAFLGALRSIAQVIAYEVVIGVAIINVLIFSGTLNLIKVVMAQNQSLWYGFVLFFQAGLFFISMLAETNRHPYDLAEAESELVSGYNVEHGSILFALFFLAEYANILLLSHLNVILFWGGWCLPDFSPYFFFLNKESYTATEVVRTKSIFYEYTIINTIIYNMKILVILFLFVWVRATIPRYRYDQLMRLGWKVFVPLSIGLLLISVGLMSMFDGYPQKGGYVK